MTVRKNKGCTVGLWVLFFTACMTATIILLLLKIFGAVQITWFTVILPLIVGAVIPVTLFIIVVAAAFIVRVFKVADDESGD